MMGVISSRKWYKTAVRIMNYAKLVLSGEGALGIAQQASNSRRSAQTRPPPPQQPKSAEYMANAPWPGGGKLQWSYASASGSPSGEPGGSEKAISYFERLGMSRAHPDFEANPKDGERPVCVRQERTVD